jgi:large subunit ribosomal protein L21
MNAIIFIGGKQYSVSEGDKIFVEKLDKKIGEEITLDKILMIKQDTGTIIGRPIVDGAKVVAEVISQTRAPKIIVFKKRPKKGYKRTIGHRQYLTGLLIKKISVN